MIARQLDVYIIMLARCSNKTPPALPGEFCNTPIISSILRTYLKLYTSVTVAFTVICPARMGVAPAACVSMALAEAP